MIKEITSSANPLVKELRKLRAHRGLSKDGRMLLEGVRLVDSARRTGRTIRQLVICPALFKHAYTAELLEKLPAVPMAQVPQALFEQIAERDDPAGVIAVCDAPETGFEQLGHAHGLWIATEGVSKPGNIGDIVRTADGVGADGVIVCGEGAHPLSTGAVVASLGAVFHVPIAHDPKCTGVGAWIAAERARDPRLQVVATSPAGKIAFHQIDGTRPTVIFMGSEQNGMSEKCFKLCDTIVQLPMVGSMDSLNVATSMAVLAYEVLRQRGVGVHTAPQPAAKNDAEG